MTKIETITPKELKKMMKLSIAIKLELGFYVSLTGSYINIDKFENLCANNNNNNVQTFAFNDDDLAAILDLVNAYARLYKHKLSLR